MPSATLKHFQQIEKSLITGYFPIRMAQAKRSLTVQSSVRQPFTGKLTLCPCTRFTGLSRKKAIFDLLITGLSYLISIFISGIFVLYIAAGSALSVAISDLFNSLIIGALIILPKVGGRNQLGHSMQPSILWLWKVKKWAAEANADVFCVIFT